MSPLIQDIVNNNQTIDNALNKLAFLHSDAQIVAGLIKGTLIKGTPYLIAFARIQSGVPLISRWWQSGADVVLTASATGPSARHSKRRTATRSLVFITPKLKQSRVKREGPMGWIGNIRRQRMSYIDDQIRGLGYDNR